MSETPLTKTNMPPLKTPLIVSAALAVLSQLTQAQPTAHYVPGVEGIKGASLPPPGIYLRDYNVFYYADTLNDNGGNKIGAVDPKAFIYANVPRLLWITDAQVLGGFLGVDALLPFQYTDVDIKSPVGRFDSSTFGIGDFFIEGTWSKHIQHFDFSLAYGIWAPTGDSAPPPTTRAGLGYWTHMLTAGATWYIDADKKWAVSALNRYEFNMEKEDTETTPGQAYTLEWGVSRSLGKTVDVGAVGYYQQKVTTDSGPNSSGARDRVAAVGPELSVVCPKCELITSIRYLYEFMAESRFQGHTIALTLTKHF
jgi:hypothetical protein